MHIVVFSVFRYLLILCPLLLVWGCGPSGESDPYIPDSILTSGSQASPSATQDLFSSDRPTAQPSPESLACAECHQDIFDQWVGSQHANANRLVSNEKDAPAFHPPTSLKHGSFVTRMSHEGVDHFQFVTSFSNQPPETWKAEMVIGITPIRQYLVPFIGGRYQTMDVSYDPRSNFWFNAFGDEDRQPHEWGHWKGRSMTWNVQCAFCHMTGFEKNYSIETDTYDSTWDAMGISCAQCHGPMEGHADYHRSGQHPPNQPLTVRHSIPQDRDIDNCASCHSRREELFGDFKPGDSYHDHYRLTLPDNVPIYLADGQVNNENFEYASFMMSRMGHMGVSCMDCHNPHSGETILPVEDNMLCMQCHTTPGFRGATPIDPDQHMFHPTGTPGVQCVDCHMPENLYMVTDWRRDHRFSSPDPLMTIEHGISNACNRCHNDQTAEWAHEFTKEWYGEKMDSKQRERTRVVARAFEGDETVGPELLKMAQAEEIDAWRATLVGLLGQWVNGSEVRRFLMKELDHASPLVRSRAINSLTYAPEVLLNDTSALVRVDAVIRQMERQPGTRPRGYEELLAYIKNISDQPAGALRQAHLATLENRTPDIEKWTRTAMEWDQSSSLPQYYLGRVLLSSGKTDQGLAHLKTAAEMDPENPEYSYSLALAFAESGQQEKAVEWLENTVERDKAFGRAWYNLGLAYSQAGREDDALEALKQAGELMSGSADPEYAAATIYMRQDKPKDAVTILSQGMLKDRQHGPSMNLMRMLYQNNPELFQP